MFNVRFIVYLLTTSFSAVIVGCASHSISNNNSISPISKSTLSATGDLIYIEKQSTEAVWLVMPKTPGDLIAKGNEIFVSLEKPITSPKVIAGVGDRPYVSVNGRDWTPAPSQIPAWARDLKFVDGWFYIVGEGIPPHNNLGVILRSKDGMNWETVYSQGSHPFTRIRHLNGGFIATGQNGVVAMSRDGKQWQQQQIKSVSAFYDADYFANEYIVTGDAQALYASSDLTTWRNLSTDNLLDYGPRNLQHNSDTLLLQTQNYLYIYRDKNWIAKTIPKENGEFDTPIGKLSPSSESFIVINNNQALQSENGIDWHLVGQLRLGNANTICESNCIVYNDKIIQLP